jgi:hypothetical protein
MKPATTIIALLFISTVSYCQSINTSTINSCGGSAKNGYYQFEWSVGESTLIDQMESAGKLIVTNGFLQPYLVNPGTNDPNYLFSVDEIKVFPNPASRYVEINFFTKQKGQVLMTLYDAIGQKIYTQEITCYGVDLIHRIPVTQLQNGSYVLNITLNSNLGFPVKQGAYRIVKIQ